MHAMYYMYYYSMILLNTVIYAVKRIKKLSLSLHTLTYKAQFTEFNFNIFENILLKKRGGVIKSDITLVKNETAIIILTLYSTLGT